MRRVCHISLMLVLAVLSAVPAAAKARTIDFPCLKNRADGRVLVDGTEWDLKMRELGYVLKDGAYVPWKVLHFEQQTVHDDIWADGMCQMKLLPVAQ